LTQEEIVFEFGKAIRFDNVKGLVLTAKTDNAGFQELRRQVLLWIVIGLLCYTFFLFLPLDLYKLLKPIFKK
jgi:hypothetical protein